MNLQCTGGLMDSISGGQDLQDLTKVPVNPDVSSCSRNSCEGVVSLATDGKVQGVRLKEKGNREKLTPSGSVINISGKLGSDAKPYQEKLVKQKIKEVSI